MAFKSPSQSISKAAELLRAGDVVAIPTETVYGLAGDAFNLGAIKKIFAVKQRPFFDPLIVHIAALGDVAKLASHVSPTAEILMKTFWPGPLTLVLPKAAAVSDLVTSGLQTVGVRMPRHEAALEIIRAAGSPLAAPSANLFGRTSPTTAAHVHEEFGDNVFVVDGGGCEVGLESTVAGFESAPSGGGEQVVIYRPGAITAEMIRVALLRGKSSAQVVARESNVAPGHLQHHYMPKIPLVIVPPGSDPQSFAVQLCAKLELREWKPVVLSLPNDATLAARQLYSELRKCAESGASVILAERRADTAELWSAIWNRLDKAATLKL